MNKTKRESTTEDVLHALKDVADKAEAKPVCTIQLPSIETLGGPPKIQPITNQNQNHWNLAFHVPTWVWVPLALWLFCKALAIAQHIYYVMTPGGVG